MILPKRMSVNFKHLRLTKSGEKGFFSILVILCLFIPSVTLTSCSLSSSIQKTKLVVFEAGSLMAPFAQIEKEFEKANPDIDVEIQAHGSIQVIRHVTELGEDVDLVAVADYSLIPMLMYATPMADGRPYANWYIKPATNQLVLAYNQQSQFSNEINDKNWYQIISRQDVKIALADPRMDAVGYRTLMVTKLAESYYNVPNIMRNAIGNHFTPPISDLTINGISTMTVPEFLESSDKHVYLRGSSMQCIALLESGDIDYAFEYKSVVEQQNLSYIELPSEINLGDVNFSENYRKVRVKIDFRRFKSVVPDFEGLPIYYGLAIPQNTTQGKEAIRFIQFLLSSDGQRIFNENHHPPLLPPVCDNIDLLPEVLKSYFR
jgi:molybdate/tungstate transport system substrate-binding protein